MRDRTFLTGAGEDEGIGGAIDGNRRALIAAIGGSTLLAATDGQATASSQPPPSRAPGGVAGSMPISIWSFLTDKQIVDCRAGVVTNCTAAFEAAQAAGAQVFIPPGTYGLTNLRIASGRAIVGAGEQACTLVQFDPTRPAIHCLSDESVGQLIGVELSGFTVRGHGDARAPAVLVAAYGTWAVLRSTFAYFAKDTLTALEIQGADAANVYNCRFRTVSDGTRGKAIFVNGGSYNDFDLFLTQCADWALDMGSSSSSVRVVSDNCVIINGQNNEVWAQVEDIFSPKAANQTVIVDRGYGNTFHTPSVNVSAASAAKLTYAFKGFHRTIFVNPQIIGSKALPHPFEPSGQPFTVIGGRASTVHKMEATFDGRGDDRNLRRVTFVGDVSDFTATATTRGAAVVQYAAPSDQFTCAIDPNTDVVLWEPAGPVSPIEIRFVEPKPLDGQTLSFSTSQTVRVRWPAGDRYAGLPTSLAGGERFQIIYAGQTERWHRV